MPSDDVLHCDIKHWLVDTGYPGHVPAVSQATTTIFADRAIRDSLLLSRKLLVFLISQKEHLWFSLHVLPTPQTHLSST